MSVHDWYVAAAYGATAIGLGGLIIWLLADQRGRRRELADLDAAGLRRRSDREAGSGP